MEPLASRMRPTRLQDIVGQEHLLGSEKSLKRQIQAQTLSSLILWGDPGTGKTTLARVLATELKTDFYALNATSDNVKELRSVLKAAADKQNSLFSGPTPILFIDEFHRFNKAQQDKLLSVIEKGLVIFIGATTENPSFEIINPLLSRCNVYTLKRLSEQALITILHRAVSEDKILSTLPIKLQETGALLRSASGDARKLLNHLELIATVQRDKAEIIISDNLVKEILEESVPIYDKNGEEHFNAISAFIKSIRGSDPNAAVFWLAKMLAGGEDVKFIARRLIILAAEDIGLADPMSMVIANSCFEAVNKIGMPEARIILSECAVYLATRPKSNACYVAIDQALKTVKAHRHLSVPLHLRNAPTKLMEGLDYGKGYKYAHNYEDNFTSLEFLPAEISKTAFYKPQDNARELEIRKFLHAIWQKKYGY